MKKLTFTEKNYRESLELAELIRRIDTIDAEYVNKVSEEIFKHQPFFLTVMLGYRADVSLEELEEIMKIYLLIWEYFKSQDNLPLQKLTQAQFEEVQRSNIHMLSYSEEEPKNSRGKIYTVELQNLKSKSLWTAVLYRCTNKPVLINMDPENKGIILIGILSFIQCFETG